MRMNIANIVFGGVLMLAGVAFILFHRSKRLIGLLATYLGRPEVEFPWKPWAALCLGLACLCSGTVAVILGVVA
jgi:hypothetical protein